MQFLLQILSIWTFGLVALATIALCGGGYLLHRGARAFWAKVTRTEPPKEMVSFFLPFYLVLGLILGGYVQAFYNAGSACDRDQQPVIPCTINLVGHTQG